MPHCTIRLFLLLAICMMTNGCRRESISEPKRHYVIGFSQCTNDLWRQIMMIQMQAEAAKYPELSIVVSNAHNNTQLQIDQIREFIEAKVDLLIISPNESEPVTPIAVEAFDMGIRQSSGIVKYIRTITRPASVRIITISAVMWDATSTPYYPKGLRFSKLPD